MKTYLIFTTPLHKLQLWSCNGQKRYKNFKWLYDAIETIDNRLYQIAWNMRCKKGGK